MDVEDATRQRGLEHGGALPGCGSAPCYTLGPVREDCLAPTGKRVTRCKQLRGRSFLLQSPDLGTVSIDLNGDVSIVRAMQPWFQGAIKYVCVPHAFVQGP